MHLKIAVAGLDPAIHVFLSALLGFQDVDARIKSGQSVRVRYLAWSQILDSRETNPAIT